MIGNRRLFWGLIFVIIATGFFGCGSPKVLYLKNNIHAQRGAREIKASYSNWINPGAGHMVIPVNTPIQTGRWRHGFYFVTLDTKRRIYFELNQRNALATPKEYIQRITSPAEVSINHLSELDRKGIRSGKALVGMSKDGVRVALGYPSPHMTSSLENDTWWYWRNRHRRVRVDFNQDGEVSSVN